MAKFIKSLLKFLLFSTLVYVVLIIIWGSFVPYGALKKNLNYALGAYGHMFTRVREAKTTKNIDILFLGSSHTYRGFDNRIFQEAGYSSFNLGSSSQSPLQTELLLKRYLDDLNPKLVIYETYSSTFSTDGVESSLDVIANDQMDLNLIEMVLKENHLKVYNSFLFAMFKNAIGTQKNHHEDLKKKEDIYISGGFVEREMNYFMHQNLKPSSEILTFEEYQLQAFQNILDMLKERNIPYVLVQAPITTSLYQSYSNNEFFDSLLLSYGPYRNFNLQMQLDDSLYFYDSHHLNQNGVEIFNQKLINWLEVEKILSPHDR